MGNVSHMHSLTLRDVGLVLCLAGCGSAELPTDGGDATKAAQVALVQDVLPAPYRARFRRSFDEPGEPAEERAYPPYDLRGSPAADRAQRVRNEISANIASSGWSPSPSAGTARVIFTDLEKREEWEQEYNISDLEELFEVAKSVGINAPSRGGASEEGQELVEKAWSYGIDSRVNKPINGTYPFNHVTLMRVGQINRNCSGTLIGRRLVLTAAHCVVNSDLSQTNQQYRARGSGASEPFGVVNTSAYWWDAGYSNNNCHNVYNIANRETCGRYDWALLLLPDNAWAGSPNGTPGWMGYSVPGSNDMENNSYARNDGYPLCGLGESPSNCVANTPYGESVGRKSVLFRGPDTSGALAIFQTENDHSPGHSGSPIWSDVYPVSGAGGRVLAVVTNQLCGTCAGQTGTTKTHPTMVRRITPWVAGFFTTQRTNFP